MATALAVCACEPGRRVRFTTLAGLANALHEADSRRELAMMLLSGSLAVLGDYRPERVADVIDTLGGMSAPAQRRFAFQERLAAAIIARRTACPAAGGTPPAR